MIEPRRWLGRFLTALRPRREHPLAGDRAIEWSWVVAHLPDAPAEVLDLGCVGSALTGIAARLGHRVTAVDLRPIEYEMDNVRPLQGDVRDLALPERFFGTIINCSTIEHIGLSGRYGVSADQEHGDREVMKRLRNLLAPAGRMLLTLPIGLDAVFPPYHRVYGRETLPALLDGYDILAEEYWIKATADGLWRRRDRQEAMDRPGGARHYALGLFVLKAGTGHE